MLDFLLTLVSFLAILTVLVFVHELGHYLAARWARVHVEVFSVGFGKELIGWSDAAGCRWRLSALPLGGYVRMKGQSDWPVTQDDGPPDADSYLAKTVFQRMVIILAGPFANFLFAVLLLFAMLLLYGQGQISQTIGEVIPDSPAAVAGLQSGDKILAINGRKITSFQDIVSTVRAAPGDNLKFEIEREPVTARPASELILNIQPQRCTLFQGETALGQPFGRIGVTGKLETTSLGVFESLTQSVMQTGAATGLVLDAVADLVTGGRSIKELAGPVGIAQASGDAARSGGSEVAFLLFILSVNLAILNLLPLPVLDGGHLVFLSLEAIGVQISPRLYEWIARIAIAALLSLMLLVTYNDISRTLFEDSAVSSGPANVQAEAARSVCE